MIAAASLSETYRQYLASGAVKPDAGQALIVERLNRLAGELAAMPSSRNGGWLDSLLGKDTAPPRGLYIHGAVGRGKTWLMDLFFGEVSGVRKRRVHFHAFMQDVHRRLHAARRHQQDAIQPVAQALADDARLLCLDEMQIGDIADAMIVGRLFQALFEQGTVVVTTSNLAPSELYRHGLNRPLFVPFIRLIEEKLDVLWLDGPADYRLGRVKAHESFVTPLGPETDARIAETWRRLTDSERGDPMTLAVLGRTLRVPEAARGCARFTFDELCREPLGPPDYLALAGAFQTVFVEHIPALKPAERNEAKRFVTLIDTLYDARIRLVASAEKPPEDIFPAADYARTVSRLREMQSASWWGKKIVDT